MLRTIDNFINRITMYRLTLWGLVILSAIGILFGFLGVLSFSGFVLLYSAVLCLAMCWLANEIFARIFHAPVNVESVWISACILFLILSPVTSMATFCAVIVASFVAMSSKFLTGPRIRHVFNPAALGALISGIMTGSAAIWWVGSAALLPFVIILGFLVVRKLRRFHLFFACLVPAILVIIAVGITSMPGPIAVTDVFALFKQSLFSWPLVFFASIMLTEPATTPPTRPLRVLYGTIVGLLVASPFHIGSIYASPELALVLGNIFSFAVSPKRRMAARLKAKTTAARDITHFTFEIDKPLTFLPGQYLEWTLPHAKPDSRGNRRYFTIASSPTEDGLSIGIKIQDQSSTFKQALRALPPGGIIYASQLTGDFTLPDDPKQKLAFVAGGIGVTPFRSMVRSLIDTGIRRDIVLFYACVSEADFAYRDLFNEAREKIGMKTVYVITDATKAPEGWSGKTGYLTRGLISAELPDAKERLFYLSGPNAMVRSYRDLLRSMGIRRGYIRTDYFPGF